MKYIDLGLPSGTLWAAENEEGYYTFDEAETEFGDCLPTKEDFEELVAHCWKKWDPERIGLEFMGPNGAKLFLPALGFRNGSDVSNVQGNGYYWSATPFGSLSAYGLYFDSDYAGWNYDCRSNGQAVRLVKRGGTK